MTTMADSHDNHGHDAHGHDHGSAGMEHWDHLHHVSDSIAALPTMSWLAGLLLALLAGALGPMVVSARQSIASDMLAHLALAGLAVGIFFDVSPFAAIIATLLMGAVLLWSMVTRSSHAPDAISMLFLSGGLAIALIFVDDPHELEGYLFGNIRTISHGELLIMTGFALGAGILLVRYWYALMSIVHIPIYTTLRAGHADKMQLLFFILLALTIGVGIKAVGVLLVGALLVLPALVSRHFVSSFLHLTLLSMILSIIGVVMGLLMSHITALPPSSMIVMTLIAMLPLSWLMRRAAGGI